MTRRHVITGALLLLACTDPLASLGGACTFNDDCRQPLVCAARVCRAPCRTDLDCTNAWLCRPSGQVNARVCLPREAEVPCLYSSECTRPQVCTRDGFCRQQCRADYDCRLYNPVAVCDRDRGICSSHPDFDAAVPTGDAAPPDVAALDARGDTGGDMGSDIAGADTRADTRADAGADVGGDTGARDVAADNPADAGGRCGVPEEDGVSCRPGTTGCAIEEVALEAGGPSGLTRHRVCVRLTDGSLRCWGDYPIGVPELQTCFFPVLIPNFRGNTHVAIGSGLGCSTDARGVHCWGYHFRGRLGLAATERADVPRMQAVNFGPYAGLWAGEQHACTLSTNGAVRCWGGNTYGEIGDNTTDDRETPTEITAASGAVELALGDSHTCARFMNGSVSCWGSNQSGAIAQPFATQMIPRPTTVGGVAGATQIAAGGFTTCALVPSGVSCWGANGSGELGVDPMTLVQRETPGLVPGLPAVTRIGVGEAGACALDTMGRVWCWGSSFFLGTGQMTPRSTPMVVPLPMAARALWVGGTMGCARLADGTLRCWGGTVGNGQSSVLVPTAPSW